MKLWPPVGLRKIIPKFYGSQNVQPILANHIIVVGFKVENYYQGHIVLHKVVVENKINLIETSRMYLM